MLRYVEDQKDHSLREAIDDFALQFKLSEDERSQFLPSGVMKVFDNRVGWARLALKNAGLIESSKRGFFKITDRGLEVLRQNPQKIDNNFLKQYSGYRSWKRSEKGEKDERSIEAETASGKTPEEIFEDSYQIIRQELGRELLNQTKECSSEFFEKLVVELLVKMGYGGSIKEAGKAIGKSGDEGIDGTIKEDVLGLDVIYIQAKKWEGIVGRPEIQKFAGALQGQRARKGIFITTGKFSAEARDYASKIDSRIVLIDGNELAEFMIDNNIGVSIVKNYEIKKVNSDYFAD
jgi:restriction system protein